MTNVMTVRARFAARLLALLAACALVPVLAQPYPSKPIRLINPYAAGGPGELLAREIGTPLGAQLGQAILIESRPGAGATLGAELVARALPDGYTLLLSGAPGQIISPAMQSKPAYDGLADFTPIAMLVTVPNVLVARASLPAQTFPAFVRLARQQPGRLTYGSSGQGSIGHLAMEQLRQAADLELVHVPYKGAAPVMIDVLAGTLDAALVNLSAALPHIKSGKLRAIAMATQRRNGTLPDLETIDEAGVRGYDAGTWWGLFGPARLPPPIVAAIYDGVAKVLADADLRVRLFQQQGADVTLAGPDALAAHLHKESAELVPLIRKLGLRME